jgi:signal transduction histidine kinase/ActR/RegA family two-component response regulator
MTASALIRRGRGALSLRSILLLFVLGLMLYAAAITVYLSYSVTARARNLGRSVQPLDYLFGDLTDRVQGLENTTTETWRLALAGRPVPADTAAMIRASAARHGGTASASSFAALPPEFRTQLAQTDEDVARLGTMLLEVSGLLELGRFDEARKRHVMVDSLLAEVQGRLTRSRRDALPILIEEERQLSATTTNAVRAVTVWMLAGMVLIPLGLLVASRLVAKPLAELEQGLARVAEGDLHVELAVQRDDEVGQLKRHFNDMTRVLRERAEEQGRFMAAGQLIAGVAHEVNNPLMAVVAMSQARLSVGDVTEEQRDELVQISRQARRAGKLLSGLLRFVRMDERPKATADLNSVARDAIDLVAYQFGVEEIILEGDLDPGLPAARGDPARLEQVLVNLLSNAIHALSHVEPPRRLQVDTSTDGEQVFLAVQDNGRGIPEELRGRIFRPFVSTKGRQGTGLGLYLSRQIAREAGGDLAVMASPGGGARFVLSLPIAISAEYPLPPRPPAPTPVPGQTPLNGLRVLLVDDEEALRRPLGKYLRRRGADVTEAGDGKAALAALQVSGVDVIVADLRMPRMDGMEMYSALEATRPDLALRLVFLSGDLSELSAAGRLQIPNDRILLKPVDLKTLEDAVTRVARLGRVRDESEAPPAVPHP